MCRRAIPPLIEDEDDDNDGMPDAWEYQYGFNSKYAADAWEDCDWDLLTNLEECLLGTHPWYGDSDWDGQYDTYDPFPLDPAAWLDTDGDRMPDELNGLSTSVPPLIEDTDDDNDGMPDAWENQHGFNSKVAGEALEDADDDWLTNLEECQLGTDPWLWDTDWDGLSDY